MVDAATATPGIRAGIARHYNNANTAVQGVIKEHGFFGSIAHGAKTAFTKHPLLAGAATVTGAYVVVTKVMGRHEENVRNRQMAQMQQQGAQR